MNKLITITTDFGDSFAAAQLMAVIANFDYDGRIAENHSVTPFSIAEGAFEIQVTSRYSPPQSVHLGVVDPGVGSNRWGIIIKTKRSWFVGPNNGLLWPGANNEDIETVWKLNEQQFDKVAHTFHGRDVFVKAAVLLAMGKAPDEFGCSEKQISDLVKYEFENGQIVHIDAYGNVKFLWEKNVKPGEKLLGIPVVRIFTDVQEGRPLILNGSSKTLELAINLGSAASYYGLKLGDNLCKKSII